ncbi:ABC transporter permease [Gracilibacillus alcaliphilus]|uniref:ABC transporter permease n=1 Tax=Gracilibacillus alcaliphilus TaxID=1401441 RepID=UPI00195DD48F|nr:putative aldouronate transport system permease protein [Gracilibacillus alcaliphilus]
MGNRFKKTAKPIQTASIPKVKNAREKRKKMIKRGLPIYLMLLPGVLYFLIFNYGPLIGLTVAFMEYDPFQGFLNSEWVGLEHFRRLFEERIFLDLLSNTLILGIYDIIFYFPAPIILALLLNEIRLRWFKSSVQTILYTPHFVSWVVIVGITAVLFSTQTGAVNNLLENNGYNRIELLTDSQYFRPLWVIHNIWNGMGWDAIIYLAAMSSVNPELYHAARVDGASRIQMTWHITLPSIMYVVIIMLILRMGGFMDLSYTHILLLQNPLNLNVSEVFDTYIYRAGILGGQFGYTTAVGLFKSMVGLILVMVANTIAKRMGKEGVY